MNIPAGYEPSDLEIPSSSEFVPPESFWLSKDSEHDWFERNAYLERKESTKGNSTKPYSRSNSQKFSVSVKSKPAIIGLPKTQKNTHVESNRRPCKQQANVRLFPKRSTSSGRAIAEPSSPKVSCIGRVRSKRCPNRNKKPEIKTGHSNLSKSKTGLVSRITSLFRSDRKKGKVVKVKEQTENSYSRRNNVMVKPVNSEPETPPEPPVLGGMNRFASGRRSEAWSEDIQSAGNR